MFGSIGGTVSWVPVVVVVWLVVSGEGDGFDMVFP